LLSLNKDLPSVSVIIPVYDAGHQLGLCLESIFSQDYPREKLEVLVIDGGSRDNTLEVAKKFPVKILHNPERYAEPGNYVGVEASRGEYILIIAADNELPVRHWIRAVMKPIVDHPELAGSIPLPEPAPGDPPMNRYFNLLRTDPLTFFIFDSFGNLFEVYRPIIEGDTYDIFEFPKDKCPLIGLAQGFIVRKSLISSSIRFDDVAPFCEMVAKGYRFALIHSVVIYHYHLRSIGHFVRKYVFRVRTWLMRPRIQRPLLFNRYRRIRMRLWFLYSLSLFWPLADIIRKYKTRRDMAWFYHSMACFLLTTIYILCALTSLRRMKQLLYLL